MHRTTLSKTSVLFAWPLLLAINLSAVAEAPYWYEVEVALIGYQDSQQIDHESWPEVLVHNDSAALEDTASQTQQAAPLAWAWIDWWNSRANGLYSVQGKPTENSVNALDKPFSQFGIAFEDKLGRFERAKGLNIIWSQKWQQPIQDKNDSTRDDNTVNINFTAPLNLDDAIKEGASLDEIEISGSVHLYRSRYLHFVSDLQVQHWRGLMSNKALDNSLAAPHSNKALVDNIIPSKSSSPLTAIDKIPLRAARVIQSRRMRSHELHYLDHPMLGILVRATPIDYHSNLALSPDNQP